MKVDFVQDSSPGRFGSVGELMKARTKAPFVEILCVGIRPESN